MPLDNITVPCWSPCKKMATTLPPRLGNRKKCAQAMENSDNNVENKALLLRQLCFKTTASKIQEANCRLAPHADNDQLNSQHQPAIKSRMLNCKKKFS